MRRNERFVSWLETELRENDLSLRALSRKTGIANSTLSHWLNGKNDPSDDNIQALADSFDIEAKYIYELLGRVEPTQVIELDEAERQIIETYRRLPTIGERKRFLRLAEAFGSYESENDRQQPQPQPAES